MALIQSVQWFKNYIKHEYNTIIDMHANMEPILTKRSRGALTTALDSPRRNIPFRNGFRALRYK